MTIAQRFLERVYTSKDSRLTSYGIGDLDILKPCLVRFNKFSKNGIALTVVDGVTTQFTSVVSKAAKEKGTQPVIIEPGGTVTIDINCQLEKDGKPSDEAGLINTLGLLFDLHGLKEGDICMFTCDITSIPKKGFSEKALKSLMSEGEALEFFVPHKFTPENTAQTVFQELGLSVSDWMQRLTDLSGSEFKEQAAYQQRKGYGDLLKERVEFFKTVDPALKSAIIEMCESFESDMDGGTSIKTLDWGTFVFTALTNI